MAKQFEVQIKEATSEDFESIADLALLAYDKIVDERQLARWLRRREMCNLVAVNGKTIVGFSVSELYKDSIQMLDLAVHPKHQRRGVGRKLVEALSGRLKAFKRTKLVVNTRDSNLDSHLFLKACGFKAIQVIRGFYDDEDAYKFELTTHMLKRKKKLTASQI